MDPVFHELQAQIAIKNQKVSQLLEAVEKIKRIQADRKAKKQ